MRRRWLVALLVLVAGCGPEFDDETKALLKKPELLSIVLDPPEAGPGQTVRASFLMADSKGALEPELQLWLPVDLSTAASSGMDQGLASLQQAIQQLAIKPPQLTDSELTFTVKGAGAYAFNAAGLARQPLSLLVQTGPLPATIRTPDDLLADLQRLIAARAVKLATRTLLVSTRADKSANPKITAISGVVYARRAADKRRPLTVARHDAADLAAARQAAADDPWVVASETEVLLTVTRPAGEVPEAQIGYQWISTGGDFDGRREREQRWVAPAYVEPGAGEQDQTAQARVNPRTDPNLHPVWLILRDSGDARLGQAWFELYVRIVPRQEKG